MANRRLTKKTPQNSFNRDNSTTAVAGKDNFFLSKQKSSKTLVPDDKSEKKPFNKAKWRVQKYSLKTKVENWKNKRAEFLRHQYRKEQKFTKLEPAFNVKKIYDEAANELSNEESEPESSKPAEKQKRRKQFEATMSKEERLKEIEKKKEEKKAKMDLYRKTRMERQKKLSARTKRGQPIMKGRMELLLEQIQKTV